MLVDNNDADAAINIKKVTLNPPFDAPHDQPVPPAWLTSLMHDRDLGSELDRRKEAGGLRRAAEEAERVEEMQGRGGDGGRGSDGERGGGGVPHSSTPSSSHSAASSSTSEANNKEAALRVKRYLKEHGCSVDQAKALSAPYYHQVLTVTGWMREKQHERGGDTWN